MKTIKQFALIVLTLGVACNSGCNSDSDREVYYMIAANISLRR